MTLEPKFEILPASQLALWPELRSLPASYVLYGGTALALRLGHRTSVDFDFFSHDDLDPRALDALPFMRDVTTLQESPNTRTVLIDRGGPVKVSFFGGIAFGRIGEPEPTSDGILLIASVLDLAGTKIKALLQRVEAKDYRDIVALLDCGVELADIFGAARALFGAGFNSIVAQKALCYFVGGDLDSLEPKLRQRLVDAATRDVAPAQITRSSQRLDAT